MRQPSPSPQVGRSRSSGSLGRFTPTAVEDRVPRLVARAAVDGGDARSNRHVRDVLAASTSVDRSAQMIAAVVCALAAAACIAFASALQHHAATDQPDYRTGVHLVARLARNPRWTIGFVISAAGLALHGVALHFGPLAIVQPLLVASLVFALPLRTILDHNNASKAELAAAIVVVAALTGFLFAAHPTGGHPGARGAAAGWVLGLGVALVAGCSATATRTSSGHVAGFTLGIATGVLYGLVGGSLKATVQDATSGLAAVVADWPLWVLIATGAWALIVNQRAYTHAPLRVSLPVLTVANPIVAVIFGAYVYDEKPGDTPAAVAVQIVCLTLLAAGVTVLATPDSLAALDATRPVRDAMHT